MRFQTALACMGCPACQRLLLVIDIFASARSCCLTLAALVMSKHTMHAMGCPCKKCSCLEEAVMHHGGPYVQGLHVHRSHEQQK